MEQSTPKTQEAVRRAVAAAHTVVVKVGSSSLTQPSGHLDVDKLTALVGAIAQVHMLGGNIVLVSSGAIAAGFGPLGFSSRPTDVATQQAAASVGQGLLMAQYEAAFGRYGIRVGQLLITAEDTMQPRQYRNARRTMATMLELGVVPIVNENDALASNEIRFGDNDRLSALIANMVRADALVLLTDVDALYTAPPSEPGMPCANSMPPSPQASAVCASRASGMPQPACSVSGPVCPASAILSPIWITMRFSSASVTSRFVPLPMMSGVTSALRRMRQSAAVSSAEDGCASARTGPPMRNEQCARMGSFSRMVSAGSCSRRRRTTGSS